MARRPSWWKSRARVGFDSPPESPPRFPTIGKCPSKPFQRLEKLGAVFPIIGRPAKVMQTHRTLYADRPGNPHNDLWRFIAPLPTGPRSLWHRASIGHARPNHGAGDHEEATARASRHQPIIFSTRTRSQSVRPNSLYHSDIGEDVRTKLEEPKGRGAGHPQTSIRIQRNTS